MNGRTPLILIILDGWGIGAPWGGNAIALSKTPNLNSYLQTAPHTQLAASGGAVGLPPDDPGNSEVGHLTIGAGKVIKQDLPLINEAIQDRSFFQNPELLAACEWVKKKSSKLHLLGLVSSGGVHSHIDHLYALLELAAEQGVKQVSIHMFTDGRDTSPYAAIIYLNHLEQKIKELGVGQVVSVIGRYYAMDRDNRWQRTQAAYEALTKGRGQPYATAQAAIATAYQNSYTDEFIPPSLVAPKDSKPVTIDDNDAVIFFNFRPDRGRQLTKAFVIPDFKGFPRNQKQLFFVTMTDYEHNLPVHVAFRPEHVEHPIAEVVSANKLTQLHIAETEKYAHVTYFLNGQREQPFPGEARILISSKKVPTYDQAPEMSAAEIAETVVGNIRKRQYDFFVINFANGDMVGHTGNLKATIEACDTVDLAVGRIVQEAASVHANVVITADHGNAEELISPKSGEIDTSHSANPVPFIILSADPTFRRPLAGSGGLADVAPTVLSMMQLPIPAEMTGKSLFVASPAPVGA